MGKYTVKVGDEFEIVEVVLNDVANDVTVTVEVKNTSEKKDSSSFLKDWKAMVVVAVFATIFSSGAYAAATGNTTVFDKLMATVITVAEHAIGKK